MNINTLDNLLNNSYEESLNLCDKHNIEVACNQDGCYVDNNDAKKLLQHETPTENYIDETWPNIQRALLGDDGLRHLLFGNVLKYLFSGTSTKALKISDLKKARGYLDWLINQMEK